MPRSAFLDDLRVVLRGRDFRKLFAVRLMSQAADGTFQVGLASLVFFSVDKATTPEQVATAAVVTILPFTLLGPFAGVLLDVWSRRQVLLLVNAVRAVLVLGTALLVIGGVDGPPIYLLALACLSLNRFLLAGLGASLPYVVPRHELVMANAVSPTCGTIAALLGAGVGFVPRFVLGAGDPTDALALLLGAAGYGFAALLARRIPRDHLGPDQRAPLDGRSARAALVDVVRDLVGGARHVRDRRPAAYALSAIGAHRLGYGIMTITLMLLCRNHFTDPADVDAGLALLATSLTVTGLGVGLAAVATPAAVRHLGTTGWIGTAIGVAAAVQLLLVIDLRRPTLFAAAFLLGFTGQGAKICVDAVVQRSVAENYRGRVFSFYDVIFNAAFVAAAGLSLVLLPADGYSRGVFGAVGVLFAAVAASYVTLSRRLPRTLTAEAVSALDLEHEPALAAQVDPRARGDHQRDAGLDRDR
ncbi:MFS transporter [Spongisporangium articulatum]|uniref:MFS transporter n=1 Tax=Spongisporangium articulatum TaxID=3362603 RepID=A0ABW8AI07_9ACTN